MGGMQVELVKVIKVEVATMEMTLAREVAVVQMASPIAAATIKAVEAVHLLRGRLEMPPAATVVGLSAAEMDLALEAQVVTAVASGVILIVEMIEVAAMLMSMAAGQVRLQRC